LADLVSVLSPGGSRLFESLNSGGSRSSNLPGGQGYIGSGNRGGRSAAFPVVSRQGTGASAGGLYHGRGTAPLGLSARGLELGSGLGDLGQRHALFSLPNDRINAGRWAARNVLVGTEAGAESAGVRETGARRLLGPNEEPSRFIEWARPKYSSNALLAQFENTSGGKASDNIGGELEHAQNFLDGALHDMEAINAKRIAEGKSPFPIPKFDGYDVFQREPFENTRNLEVIAHAPAIVRGDNIYLNEFATTRVLLNGTFDYVPTWTHLDEIMEYYAKIKWTSVSSKYWIYRHETGHLVHESFLRELIQNEEGFVKFVNMMLPRELWNNSFARDKATAQILSTTKQKKYFDLFLAAKKWKDSSDLHVTDNLVGLIYHEFRDRERIIAEEVSKYAASRPSEFIAEYLTGVISGKVYSLPVRSLYMKYGGQPI
jgi:hypothetical protein